MPGPTRVYAMHYLFYFSNVPQNTCTNGLRVMTEWTRDLSRRNGKKVKEHLAPDGVVRRSKRNLSDQQRLGFSDIVKWQLVLFFPRCEVRAITRV